MPVPLRAAFQLADLLLAPMLVALMFRGPALDGAATIPARADTDCGKNQDIESSFLGGKTAALT